MWHPHVSGGSVKDKIQSHSWLLLSLALPSAPDTSLSLCSVLPQEVLQAVLNSNVKQGTNWDPGVRHIGEFSEWLSHEGGMNGHYASGFQTKLRYLCSTAQCRCFYSPQAVRREVLPNGNALSAFMLISRWVESSSQRLCFTLGPPRLLQSLGKLVPFESKGNNVQKNYPLLRMR